MVTAEYNRNYEQNGIEIKFSNIPDEKIRKELLANKWRYHKKKQLWYIYYNEKNLDYARKLCKKYSTAKETKIEKSKSIIAPTRHYSYGHTNYGILKTEPENKTSVSKFELYSQKEIAEAGYLQKGVYRHISPHDYRFQKKRSFFS